VVAAAVLFASGCADRPGTEITEVVPVLQFDTSLRLEEAAETSANVSIGDLNRDGHLDILLVKGRHWPLADMLLIGDGQGAFAPARPLGAAPDRSYSGELVDLDADGDLDVVISNDYPDPKLTYLNDSQGGFVVGSIFGQAEWPTRHVTVADLNADGQPDIVVANRSGDTAGLNYVCLNRGGGRFDSECIGFSQESATTITVADFDSDGDLDLAVPHREGGQSYIYLNDGAARFGERQPFGPADAAIRKAEAADLNHDGLLDLVVIDERKGAALYRGQVGGGFAEAIAVGAPVATPYALAVGDLNQDGHPDVIVGYVNSRPVAFFGDGLGGFQPIEFGDNEGVAYGFAIGDINEDGYMDIAMARSDAPNVLYFGARATR
jgi:hypothetical protein